MENLLTDRSFWVNYWENKTDLAVQIPSNYLFHLQLEQIARENTIKTAIELGGFPGYYAVFLKKYLQIDSTLLDYFVHPPIVNNLLKKNSLKKEDIGIIEADLFNYQNENQYDLVLSCGLIEHFNDTKDILQRHLNFLKPDGILFISLPNFNAVNGWFQKKFDKANYDKHFIECMNPDLLRDILEKEGLKVSQSGYFGKFSLWLENEKEKSFRIRLFKKLLWLTGKIITKLIPLESKILSPYIVVIAKK